MSLPFATSRSLQASPTSSAANVCGSGRFVNAPTKALMAMESADDISGHDLISLYSVLR
jgi:hypothetical protein